MKYAKLTIQPNGKYSALALHGTPAQVQDTYNTFWQWGITNGELNEGRRVDYVWTKPERILRGLTALVQNHLLAKLDKNATRLAYFKGRKGGVYPLARAIAERIFKGIKQDIFLTRDDMVPRAPKGERACYLSGRN
jgi:hypothetical protein